MINASKDKQTLLETDDKKSCLYFFNYVICTII